jgi:beta-mannosidase
MREFERVDDWTYETVFDAPRITGGEAVRLVFEGIDTVAEVCLNGVEILRCDNMLIPHTVDVTGRLAAVGNILQVRIHSAELHARRFPYPAGQASRGHRQAEAYLRKARHMWGWDNAPRLLSAGLWRPVYLEVLPPVRFEEVFLYTLQVTDTHAWIGCNWKIATPDLDLGTYRGVWQLSASGRVEHRIPFAVEFTAGRVWHCLPREALRLWWPRNLGESHLYDAALLLYRDDVPVARWDGRMGIRDLELRYSEVTDSDGNGEFVFVCNGEKVYINGTNWKPLDALHSRAAAKVTAALDLCLDLNCNMVRIWGGGVYEDHAFFDYCDRNGLLVWQDFMFACEVPPRDPSFCARVAHEAEVMVKRLRNHPSLAVWCGDNEVDATLLSPVMPRSPLPSDNHITRRVLRDAVLDHDPYRTYVPSSPYVSDEVVLARRLPRRQGPPPATPEDHLYPADECFRDAFRRSAAHFIGETGPYPINAMSQSPDIVARELDRARRLWDCPVDPADYTIERHQTDSLFATWKDATRKRLRHLFAGEFGPEPSGDLALAVNIVCGEVFKFAIEWSRSRKFRKTGVLWWSLLDMWPMMFNFSVVDYNLRPKQPCFSWIRRSQQPVCLMVVTDDDDSPPELFAVNDTLEPVTGSYRITCVDATGAEQELDGGVFALESNGNGKVRSPFADAGVGLWLIQWQIGDRSFTNHYINARPPYGFEVYAGWVQRLDALDG